MHIQKPLRITKGNNCNRIGPCPYSFIMNICLVYMDVFARFDEIHSMTRQDFKGICTYKTLKNYKRK